MKTGILVIHQLTLLLLPLGSSEWESIALAQLFSFGSAASELLGVAVVLA